MDAPGKYMDKPDNCTLSPYRYHYAVDMIGDMEFVFQPGVQAIFDHMAALHGLRIAFYTPDGSELRVGQARENCLYCRRLREHLGFETTCRVLDQRRHREAAEKGRLVAYECHGGMTEAVLPVRVAGRLLGFVMVGQFRARPALPPTIRARARRARMEIPVANAFARAPYYGRKQTRHLLALLQVLVDYIIEHHMIDVQDSLAPLIARLREHPEERLSLAHAAALTGCSEATLSRRFKQKLGHSFQAVKIELMLEKADEYLRDRPSWRVGEVAGRLGFDDPLYFSRLYRRHRGVSPREARRRDV